MPYFSVSVSPMKALIESKRDKFACCWRGVGGRNETCLFLEDAGDSDLVVGGDLDRLRFLL